MTLGFGQDLKDLQEYMATQMFEKVKRSFPAFPVFSFTLTEDVPFVTLDPSNRKQLKKI